MSWLSGLTGEQRAAAGATVGDAWLLAGPGTGKTYVLVRRAEFLLGVIEPEDTLLALTFTRAAAAEMRERLQERLGPDAERVQVSTLHAYALGQLMASDTRYLPRPLRIAGNWEERHVIAEELKLRMGYERIKEVESAFLALANDWDTLAADLSSYDARHADPVFFGEWTNHRNVYGYTLRAELVYQLLQELRSDPVLTPKVRPRVVLVDEYQDLNLCDLHTVRELAERSDATVFGAGDDDQSIYSFRHAAPSGIRQFDSDYPGATPLRLRECRRCGPEVVGLATRVIEQERDRALKELESTSGVDDRIDLVRFINQDDEAVGVAQIIDAQIAAGTPPEKILVLFKKDRNGTVSRALDEQLFAAGHSAYRPRVNDDEDIDLVRLQCYLQLGAALVDGNVDHLSLRVLLKLEDNGVGDTTLGRILDLAITRGVRYAEAIELLRHANPIGLHGRPRFLAAVDAIYEQARALAPLPDEATDDFAVRVAGELGVNEDALAVLRRVLSAKAAPVELEDLRPQHDRVQELLAALNGVADVVPASVEDNVTITTMHGAKGLTADVVIVCQLEDEILPGLELTAAQVDEQRRLLYVSLTRARHRLVLSSCSTRTGAQGFSPGHTHSVTQALTRFLQGHGLRAVRVGDLT